MNNLCEEVLIIYNGHFFPKKRSKNVQINHFVKTAFFLERQLLLTKLQIVRYFSFKLLILYCCCI